MMIRTAERGNSLRARRRRAHPAANPSEASTAPGQHPRLLPGPLPTLPDGNLSGRACEAKQATAPRGAAV